MSSIPTDDRTLSVIDASGRQISLLNNDTPHPARVSLPILAGTATPDHEIPMSPSSRMPSSPNSYSSDEAPGSNGYDTNGTPSDQQSKRKYHCSEPGCTKSFTTSGHLARHNRIHTGEKNFPCLFPGCQSRFSRQDNMMQHYRTHMSPKSRRTHKKSAAEEARPRPRLHAHHRIRSDPVQVEPPLTIDQHLSNYHRSLRTPAPAERFSPVRCNQFPKPLFNPAIPKKSSPRPLTQAARPSPPASPSLPSIQHIIDTPSPPAHPAPSPVFPTPSAGLFYQHRPLTFPHLKDATPATFSLLHPTLSQSTAMKKAEKANKTNPQNSPKDHASDTEDTDTAGSSSGSLLQLAHIVSTFG